MLRANEVYPIRPERAEALSPGHRPGYYGYIMVALKGQKLFMYNAFALSGRLGLVIFFYFLQFLLKSSPIHFAGNGQTEREGNPDAQQSHAARETEGITQWQ